MEKGYGIKEKCAALNISKFKLQASAKYFTPILPEWPKGRIFSIDSQEQWDICMPKMKEVLYEVRCLKSTEDMILALAGQFKQLSHEPEKFR